MANDKNTLSDLIGAGAGTPTTPTTTITAHQPLLNIPGAVVTLACCYYHYLAADSPEKWFGHLCRRRGASLAPRSLSPSGWNVLAKARRRRRREEGGGGLQRSQCVAMNSRPVCCLARTTDTHMHMKQSQKSNVVREQVSGEPGKTLKPPPLSRRLLYFGSSCYSDPPECLPAEENVAFFPSTSIVERPAVTQALYSSKAVTSLPSITVDPN
ncbi:unnamed protein product [Pleuronectes platessa]|uniref:Uncharacterized protein n=1 Tax=Pleuronectes platessa TaxID=8262 RepID=A0A9N7TG77_PLEPL|nr:unnamed protein product [Pleuronectes platessa]